MPTSCALNASAPNPPSSTLATRTRLPPRSTNFESLLGPIDILINNAGASSHPSLERTTPEGFAQDVHINVNGAYNCAYAVLPGMKARRAGIIVNIGSVNGLGAYGDAAYSVGKAGLISLTKSLALEFGRYNLRVNIVCPATVRTPIWDERASRNPNVLEQLARWYPLGRIVEPIEVIHAVAFLASDAASGITGVVLPVDCGLTAGNIVMARELTLEDSRSWTSDLVLPSGTFVLNGGRNVSDASKLGRNPTRERTWRRSGFWSSGSATWA